MFLYDRCQVNVCNGEIFMTKEIKKDRVWIKGQTLTAAQMAEKRENDIINLTVGFMGSILGVFVLRMFNSYLISYMPTIVRAPLMMILYWLVAIIPIMLIRQEKASLGSLGFEKKGIIKQILLGIGLGLGTSLLLTGVPYLIGLGKLVSNGKFYTEPWQFIYEFGYCILAVGAAEELVFRGFIYNKLKTVFENDVYAVIGSSVMFGLFHILSGNILQVLFAALLGLIFCLFRNKIKGCTLMTLVICHGIYDAMITVWPMLILSK